MAATLGPLLLAAHALPALAQTSRQGLDYRRAVGGREAGSLGYIPGGVVRAPHVQLRPAISYKPSGESRDRHGWPGGLSVGRQATPPAMTANTVSGPFQPDSPDALARFIATLPGFVPVKAMQIIKEWAETAASVKAKALEEDDEGTLARMIGAEYTLTTMQQFVTKGMTDYTLALTTDGGMPQAELGSRSEDILALATIHQTAFLQHSGRLASVAEDWGLRSREDIMGGTVHAVDISAIVASPRVDRQRGVGAALIRKIADWAASNGRLVTMIKPGSWEAEAYLHGLGFESTDVYGTDIYMVYSGYGFERPPDNPAYHMVALEM